MSKSIPAILGLGAAGCVLLSLSMKSLAEYGAEKVRSPYLPVLENKFGARLVGPLRLADRREGERRRLLLEGCVMAGLNRRKLADAMGFEVWIATMRASDTPDEVVVVLSDEDGGPAQEFVVLPPTVTHKPGAKAPPTPPQGR